MKEVFMILKPQVFRQDNHRIVEIACIETRDLFLQKIFHKQLNQERRFGRCSKGSWFYMII